MERQISFIHSKIEKKIIDFVAFKMNKRKPDQSISMMKAGIPEAFDPKDSMFVPGDENPLEQLTDREFRKLCNLEA